MDNLVKYGLFALVIGGIYFYSSSDDTQYAADDIDLNAVLDVTVDTLYAFEDNPAGQVSLTAQDDELAQAHADQAFLEFASVLESDYNAAVPALHTQTIGVAPQTDASLLAYEDLNANQNMDENEDALFLIEIDGENARIIASSRSGAINEHHFSGTGLLTGYLLGSMLSRQRSAGVSSSQLASKKPVTAKSAARARAGSGSHSKGK